MINKNVLIGLLVVLAFYPAGCSKVGWKEPLAPGVSKTFGERTEAAPSPRFSNGDIVRYKMLADKHGIMMQSDYKYVPRLGTWYCIVDFYPSSAPLHFDLSKFDNYERRYVYEFELELVRAHNGQAEISPRWKWMAALAE